MLWRWLLRRKASEGFGFLAFLKACSRFVPLFIVSGERENGWTRGGRPICLGA